MRKFKIFVGIFLITASLLIACDDFFSPTIEIFNKTETPINVDQEEEKNKEENQEIINQY